MRLAVLGHAGHGKSALASALVTRAAQRFGGSGLGPLPVDDVGRPDRSVIPRGPWQRAFCFDTSERSYVGLDVVAHERLGRMAGVAVDAVDAGLLVVSAVEGVMPETRSHAHLARSLPPGHLVVFLSHCDEVFDPDQLDLAEVEVRQLLYDVGFEGDEVTLLRGATPPARDQRAAWAPALDALLVALDDRLRDLPRDPDAPLQVRVIHRWDRAATPGRVAKVSVHEGTLVPGTVLRCAWGPVRYEVRALRVFDRPVARLAAGEIGTAHLVPQDIPRWVNPRLRLPTAGERLTLAPTT